MEYITYDEFKEEVEKLGYKVEKDRTGVIWVEALDGLTVSRIGNERYSIIVYKADVQEVAELSIRLAITPLDKRESKYYLKLKNPIISERLRYINYDKDAKEFFVSNKRGGLGYQTIFTKEEIDKLREEYNVLAIFYMEAVND